MEITLDEAFQRGVEAQKAGRLQEATKFYRAILKVYPKHPDVNHNMGVLSVGLGNLVECIPFFKIAVEQSPLVSQYWTSYVQALIRFDKIGAAQEAIKQARDNGLTDEVYKNLCNSLNQKSNEPKNGSPSNVQVANITQLYADQKYLAAINRISILLQSFPNFEYLYNIQGACYASLNKSELAIKSFTKALSINSTNAELYYNLGVVLHKINKLDESITNFEKALKFKPVYAKALNNLGMIFKEKKKLDKAAENFSKAIKLKPNFSQAYMNLASMLKDNKQYSKAISTYLNLLKVRPNHFAACNNLGNLFRIKNDFKSAKDYLHRAISIKSDYFEAYNNLGITYYGEGSVDEAIENYKKALKLNPTFVPGLVNLGTAKSDKGNYANAITIFKKVLALDPLYSQAYNNLANTYKKKGDIFKAITNYTEAIRTNNDNFDAIVNLENLLLQLTETKHKDLVAGFIIYKKNKLLVETNPKHQIHAAIRSFLLGERVKSINSLKKYNEQKKNKQTLSLDLKDRQFCDAYYTFINHLIGKLPDQKNETVSKIYHIGESHCLSYAHHNLLFNDKKFVIVPSISLGAKAYHFTTKADNEYKSITKYKLNQIPRRSIIFISFGEIDCRQEEGFITASKKTKVKIKTLIDATVSSYLKWFRKANKKTKHLFYFFTVPAPVYDHKYSFESNQNLAQIIKMFNIALWANSKVNMVRIIDIYGQTVNKAGFSNRLFHSDTRHLDNRILPIITSQLEKMNPHFQNNRSDY